MLGPETGPASLLGLFRLLLPVSLIPQPGPLTLGCADLSSRDGGHIGVKKTKQWSREGASARA